MTNINSRKFLIAKWKNSKRIKKNIFSILFLLGTSLIVTTSSYAQKTIKVKNSIGTCFIEGDISPNQAKINAFNDAKLNALLKAGISENISSYKTIYKKQENKNFEQVFTSQFQSELKGNIIDYEIKAERIYCKNELEIIYEIIIDANIIKYKSELDNKFQVNIENLKLSYLNGEDFGFLVKSTHDSYLTVFDLLDTTAVLLYPQSEESKKIIRNSEIKFPFDGDLHAELSPGNVATSEHHRLLLIFTKEAYPFILYDPNYFTSYEKLIGWVNSIEPNQKNVQYYSFIISPK
jgi:hypothetical protein